MNDVDCLAYKMSRLITEKKLGSVLASRARKEISESLQGKDTYLKLYKESWVACCEVGKAKDVWEE